MIKFVVPVQPISTNHAYKPGRWGQRHGLVKTEAAKEYQVAVALCARHGMRGTEPLDGPCSVRLVFYYPSSRFDIDGAIKLTLDAMQKSTPKRPGGCVFKNDSQVTDLVVGKRVDPEHPRVEVEVSNLPGREVAYAK